MTMIEPSSPIMQQQLVKDPGKKLPQYLTALAATMSAIGTGTMLGWSAPAALKLKEGEYGFNVTDAENAWIGSIATLGAAVMSVPIGYIAERIGRKLALLLLILPFTLGWLLISFATNVDMLYAGRFFTGMGGGAVCVVAPIYVNEIAQDEIRGTVGTFLQLMVNVGILFTFIVGGYSTVFLMSILCGVIPLVFGVIFFFMPETPYYLASKDLDDKAKMSLVWLRGEAYDVNGEFDRIKNKIEEDRKNNATFKELFSERAAKMGLLISLVLMFLLQFSGINAVLFNSTEIFDSSGSNISAEASTIIMGSMQLTATLVSAFIIDKVGRKILLLLSTIIMSLSGFALGTFFYLKNIEEPDLELIESISWLPLVSLSLFVIAFSFGLGAIPWLMFAELCRPNTIAFVGSSATTLNWISSFIITRTFIEMQAGLGEGGTFWFFATITFLGSIFVAIVIPETKGKSIDEIQNILNGKNGRSID